MNKNITSKFRIWTPTLCSVLLAWALLKSLAHAGSYSYQLRDGTLVVMTIQTNQTTLTLTGIPREKFYKLEATENLLQWVTLDARFKLNNAGTYIYTDRRALPKCFYRIAELQ